MKIECASNAYTQELIIDNGDDGDGRWWWRDGRQYVDFTRIEFNWSVIIITHLFDSTLDWIELINSENKINWMEMKKKRKIIFLYKHQFHGIDDFITYLWTDFISIFFSFRSSVLPVFSEHFNLNCLCRFISKWN